MFSQASVILSTEGGVYQHAMGRGMYTPGQTPPGQTLPLVAPTPPPEMATETGGTHSTGMHSCLMIFLPV